MTAASVTTVFVANVTNGTAPLDTAVLGVVVAKTIGEVERLGLLKEKLPMFPVVTFLTSSVV